MKRFMRTLCIIVLLFGIGTNLLSSWAGDDVPEFIRVGLAYASSAKLDVVVSSETDFALSYDTEDSLVSICESVGSKELWVSKREGAVAVSDVAYQTYDEAKAAAQARRDNALKGIPAYINDRFLVCTSLSGETGEGEIALVLSPNALSVNSDGQSIFIFDSSDKHINLVSTDGIIETNGTKYRGTIELKVNDEGRFTVINRVGFDDYLKGVVPKEVSASWHIEALKAQAVVARTYAVTQMDKFKSYGFNVNDTTASQVYGGYSAEQEQSNLAVDETSGELVRFNGKPAQVFFFATSGGMTENSENVWSGIFDYLKSVPDRFEDPAKATRYFWQTQLTAEEIKEKLSARSISIGDITDIIIDELTPSGRVYSMTFKGTQGEKTITKDACRTVLGLYSQSFDIRRENQSVTGGEFAVISADGTSSVKIDNTKVLSASGVHTITKNAYITDGANDVGMDLDETGADEGAFVFEGRGWGHGIGMSQWGAKGMADNGYTYTQIIKHYFIGTEVG